MDSVHPPLGEKQTFVMSAWKANAVTATKLKIRNNKAVVVILFMGAHLKYEESMICCDNN
jgi:hypothetical protein